MAISVRSSGTTLLTGTFRFRGALDSCLEVGRLVCPNVIVNLQEQWVGNTMHGQTMQGCDCRAPGRPGEWHPSRVRIIPQSTGDHLLICESGPDV